MSPDKNIHPLDQLFKESLSKAEFEAPQGLWESINAGVQAANTAAGAGAAAKSAGWLAKGIIAKVIGGAVITGAIIGTAIWVTPSSQTSTTDKNIPGSPAVAVQHAGADKANIISGPENGHTAPPETKSLAETSTSTPENNASHTHNATRGTSGPAAYGTGHSQPGNKRPAANPAVSQVDPAVPKQPEKAGAEGYFVLNDSLVCEGEEVICTSRINQPSSWRVNGEEVRDADPSQLKYTFEHAGTYFISQGNYTRQVKVTPLQAKFTAEYTGKGEYSFTAACKGTLAWDFGDGAQKTTRNANIEHSYLRAGNGLYRVLLTVISNKGCLDTISKMVENKFDPNARRPQVPNVFTPNSDGYNDRFEISWDGDGEYRLTIFTTTAQQVFESSQVQQTWDGTNQSNGKLCPMGVYYYVIRYQLPDGTSETLKGQVTLIP